MAALTPEIHKELIENFFGTFEEEEEPEYVDTNDRLPEHIENLIFGKGVTENE